MKDTFNVGGQQSPKNHFTAYNLISKTQESTVLQIPYIVRQDNGRKKRKKHFDNSCNYNIAKMIAMIM